MKTIFCDLDDTLNEFTNLVLMAYHTNYDIKLSLNSIKDYYDLQKLITEQGVTFKDFLKDCKIYEYLPDRFPPTARDFLNSLSRGEYKLVICTARKFMEDVIPIFNITKDELLPYMRNIKLIVCNAHDKLRIIIKLKPDIIIEDNPYFFNKLNNYKYAEKIVQYQIKKPWNTTENGESLSPSNVITVNNVGEISL